MQNVRKLPQIVNGIDLNYLLTNNDCCCVICAETRMKNLPYRGHIELRSYENELIYANIFSPIEDAPAYARYLYLFTEDTTKAYLGHLMPDKSAASIVASFKAYEKSIEKPSRPIRRFHLDKDPVYKSDPFHNLRYKKGIV